MSLSSWNQTASAMFPTPSKKLVRSKSGLRIVSQQGWANSPWSIEEPEWAKDEEWTNCSNTKCKAKFDFLKRRHHCRRCGNIFCGTCAGDKVQFHRMGFIDPVRHCKTCSNQTRKEVIFFEQDLKILMTGAPFIVSSEEELTDDQNAIGKIQRLYNCRLSSDERFLILSSLDENNESTSKDWDPVDLSRILSCDYGPQPQEDREENSGNGQQHSSSSVTLRIKLNPTEEMKLLLESPPEPSRKPSVAWIGSFKVGMKMVFDSKSTSEDKIPIESS